MKPCCTTPAIVCDADKLCQVAIIQELGRLGIPVIAIAPDRHAIGLASKYVMEPIICPIPSYDPGYINFLVASVRRGVLFYSNDANTENISRHSQSLIAAGFRVFVSPISTLQRVIEKECLYETANECGVSVPKSCLVSTEEELRQALDRFPLPAILKSTNLAGGIYRFIDSRESASAVFHEMAGVVAGEAYRHRCAHLMVQQWIPQEGARLWNFNACVRAGEIVCFSMGERIRTDVRPDGTLGSVLLYGKTAYNAPIHELNERLFRHLNFNGIAETEWSENSNQATRFYLYDFNPRPSGNIRWTFRSGVSLAEQQYRLSLGWEPTRPTMRQGVVYAKVFYLQNDFLYALTNSKLSLCSKLRVLAQDMMAVTQGSRHAVEVLDYSDLGPTMRAVRQLTSAIAIKVVRLVRRATLSRHRIQRSPQTCEHEKLAL